MSDEFKCCNQHDHVSREDLYKEFKRHFTAPKDWCKLAKSIIDVTPPADVAPVIHGHWKNKYERHYIFFGTCSVCKHVCQENNICGNCGAIMDESEDNNE